MSIPGIAKKLGIAKSTASLWLKDVALPTSSLEAIRKMRLAGKEKGRLMIAARREVALKRREDGAEKSVGKLFTKTSSENWALIAALLFWCEGSKQLSSLHFTNSDPRLIRTFLVALRRGFHI